MKCHRCAKSTKDLNKIKCSAASCGRTYCCLCINISGLSNEKKNNWKCPDCNATQKKGGDGTTTTPRPVDTTSTAVTPNSEVKELTNEVRLLTKEISSLKTKLERAIDSLSNCEKRLDELGTSVAINDNRLKRLEEREQQTDVLKATVKDLQQELNTQAQNHLRNELELSGIPETNNENLHHIALLAARKVGVQLDDRDIDWVTRVGPRGKPATVADDKSKFARPVVVRLLCRSKRDEIIKAAKTRRNITSTDIEIPGTSQKIFYNERLTKQNRELFRESRTKAKQQGFLHCWCSQGTIYVRQHDGKPARPVRTHDDLASILTKSGITKN